MLLEDVDLAVRAEAWLGSGLCTEPAERAAAEAGVRRAYATAGLPAPAHIVWLGSPEAGAYAVALLSAGDTGPLPTAAELVRTRLLGQGLAPGAQPLGRCVRAQVRTGPWARARGALTARLGGVGFARHWAASARRPWQQLNEQLVTPLRTRLDAQFAADTGKLGPAARAALLDVVHGQHDAAWLPAFTGAAVEGELAGLAAVAASAGWWWAYEHVAILTERPTALHRDNLGRLHHDAGPALSYPDGFALYAWRGMPIPPDVAAELPRLTVARIRAEENAEVRRVMVEYYGFDRYLADSNAKQVHRDETGILWRAELPGDEPLVMVEVINSTPEPDGTSRTYFLRVPPNIRTARAGVAWTFGITEEEYQPLLQT